ncbi:hypothetical protein RCH23_001055 [Cryobacterium sp. CAN_C3]|nr:hypothetical protein [Cryobacterium sp. CAN_C3]
MIQVKRLAPAVLLVFLLSGCTNEVTAPPSSPESIVAIEPGADLGNDRPVVTFDGLMVRRRVALAVRAEQNVDLPALRAELERRATDASLTLSDIPPDVLPAGLLDQAVPALTMLLPDGTTTTQTRAVIGPEASLPSVSASRDSTFFVVDVLVHDLRFEVLAADPAAAADAIATEGIVSDALGNYSTTLGAGLLRLNYLGPLLSDDLVESVRVGIARGAGTDHVDVAVWPESLTGVGVDMAIEPEPAPAVIAKSMVEHTADRAEEIPTPLLGTWAMYGIGLTVLLGVTVAIVLGSVPQRRRRSAATGHERVQPDPRSP